MKEVVVFIDMGSRSLYDWPGEVYVLNGATGAKKYNATFGNGGGYASVSIANINDDDYEVKI